MTEAILVVGSGQTTRANVEALMDDYFYANPELKVFITVQDAPSDGQVWAATYAQDNGKTVQAYMVPGAKMTGIPVTIPREEHKYPIEHACEEVQDLVAFVIWNDEDQACLEALEVLPKYGYLALDLTNGLVEIKPAGEITKIERPDFIEMETLTALEELSIRKRPETDVEAETGFDEDEDEEGYEDPLYEAVRVIAGIFAETLAAEIVKALGK